MNKVAILIFLVCFILSGLAAEQSQEGVPEGFVIIPEGTFLMGSPDNEGFRNENEGPQRQVTLTSFLMGIYPVTQKEYFDIMGLNPSERKDDNLPVTNVTWFNAIEYCNLRSLKEGFTPAYTVTGPANNRTVVFNQDATGYRLPTEAEWEYACRAETTTPYSTGTAINDNTGWHYGNNSQRLQPVGQKPANTWGLFDMHGNVWEWCWDWHGAYLSGVSAIDPKGASDGTNRVSRGGGWSYADRYLRSAYRGVSTPGDFHRVLGFRVVKN